MEVEVVQQILPGGGFKLVDNVVKLDSDHLCQEGMTMNTNNAVKTFESTKKHLQHTIDGSEIR